MTGILLLLTFAYLLFSAIMHDKVNDDKRLKDWGFWIIEAFLLIFGVSSLNDSRPTSLFTAFMIIVLGCLLNWRISDLHSKNLKGSSKAIHIIITIAMCLTWFAVAGSIINALNTPEKYHIIHTKSGDRVIVDKDNH